MRPDERDAAYLVDMLQAAKAVGRYVSKKSREDFARDDLLRSAVERQIEIIGEAARKVSPGFQAEHPAIPWRGIITTRHILAHEYGRVDEEIIWQTAVVYVPELMKMLEPLMGSPPPDPEPDASTDS
jgi:uncharacterized protein with HEPN domain